MPLAITCSNCNARLRIPDATVGKMAKCPGCATQIPVAAAVPVAPLSPAMKNQHQPANREAVSQASSGSGGIGPDGARAVNLPESSSSPAIGRAPTWRPSNRSALFICLTILVVGGIVCATIVAVSRKNEDPVPRPVPPVVEQLESRKAKRTKEAWDEMNRLRKMFIKSAAADKDASSALEGYRTLAADLDLINKDDVDPELTRLIGERIDLMREMAAEHGRFINEFRKAEQDLNMVGKFIPDAKTEDVQKFLDALGNVAQQAVFEETVKRHVARKDAITTRIGGVNKRASELGRKLAGRYSSPFEN